MSDRELTHKVDRLTIALILLTSSLRANVIMEEGEVIASIPVMVLDQIEAILNTL